MKEHKRAESVAEQRFHLISPLLAEGVDPAKEKQIKASIGEQFGVSERTLRRYIAAYRTAGFEGLKPKGRESSKLDDAIPAHLLEQAILLRREVPSRSVSSIIQIMEWEGLAAEGQLKRSTLQEKLTERGYSTRQMKMYANGGIAARRFQQKHRNKLWQSDIKYGPYLPIGKDGTKKQVFLVTVMDDCTRFILHAEFYPTLDQIIVEDCLRKAIQKFGVPDSAYFDNGVQYRNKWMKRACSKLGVRLLYAKPYSPESTGKPEKLNRLVGNFMAEIALEKPKTLDRLNQLFWVWMDECYQNKPHSALGQHTSPQTAYRGDTKALSFLDPDVVAQAFLHCEDRKVDKSGCISFQGRKYEVGLAFIGCTVDVVYDPADITEITIEYEGHTPWKARELQIGERAGKRPALPDHMGPKQAESSRLLAAAEKQNQARKEHQTPAISYRSVGKGDARRV